MIYKNIKKNNGSILLQVLVFASISVAMMAALTNWAAITLKAGRNAYNREQAFESAEAGIDYYRWHLAHSSLDYQDGTNTSGPYVHNLLDKDGNNVGQFSLTITPPGTGSTLVKIKSTGTYSGDTNQKRIIESRVSKPSVAENSFAGNAAMRFGVGTEVYGTIRVNGGIRFDGLAHSLVSSGAATYTDTDSDRCTSSSYGVHTCVATQDPAPNGTLQAHSDVFAAGRKMSVPLIDFTGFTADMSTLKTAGQSASGFYRDAAGTGFVGYHIILKTDDTFDLYKINSWVPLPVSPNACTIDLATNPSGSTWSINSETIQGNYPFPVNGVIFVQDHLVLDGQINGARLTIVASTLPEPTDTTQYKNIIINNNLLYTNFDGTDSLGIVAQGGVDVGMVSVNTLTIDGALMAQHNSVGRFYYVGNSCNTNYVLRSTLNLYGMIASNLRYGFAYGSPASSGYSIRNINYDGNLLYAPPPSFPLTSSQYQILSWQELQN